MPKLKAEPTWKRALFRADGRKAAVGVDREGKVIRGLVIAQEGPFKSEGRGEFDSGAIKEIARLTNAARGGLRSRFAHPGLSSDGIGSFLGREKNARVEEGVREGADGRRSAVSFVRADLHLAESAFTSPQGNLGQYVMDLAAEDPGALSSSLVIEPEITYRRDEKNRPLTDEGGNELPPLWFPKRLWASDIVDEGDAVHGSLLSAEPIDWDNLPDAFVRHAHALLDSRFAGADRASIEARCSSFLTRYLDARFGPTPPAPAKPYAGIPESLRLRLAESDLAIRKRRAAGGG